MKHIAKGHDGANTVYCDITDLNEFVTADGSDTVCYRYEDDNGDWVQAMAPKWSINWESIERAD